MPAPTFVDKDVVLGATRTSLAFTWNNIAGEADDDVAIAFLYGEALADPTSVPSGWTLYHKWDHWAGIYRAHVYWRRRAGDTGAVTFSFAGNVWRHGFMAVYRGLITSGTPLAPSTPVEDIEALQNDEPSHPGITVDSNNSGLLYATWAFAGGGITTGPTGYTSRESEVAPEIHFWDDLTVSTGATGTVSADLVNPEYCSSILIELVTEASITAAITGTATASIDEADIVAGGKTIIETLAGTTFVANGVTNIQLVGRQRGSFVGSTTAQDITFSLTGGLASTPAAGDLVFVSYAIGTAGRTPTLIIENTSGTDYTDALPSGQIAVTADAFDSILRAGYRFMPGTPETVVRLTSSVGGTGHGQDAGIYDIIVLRGVDTVTPMDVTATEASGQDTRLANPPSITPATVGAWTYHCGAASGAVGGTFASSDLTDFLAGTQAETNDAFMGAGTLAKPWSSGAQNPAVFTGGGTDTANDSWTAFSVAFRPVVTNPFNDARQDIIDGLDSAQSEGTGWDAVVKAGLAVTDVVRTSSTVVTITLPAFASYDITAQETITVTVPASALASGGPITGTPTFTVDEAAGGVTATPGTASLTITSFTPTVSAPRLVTPSVVALTTTSFAPSVVLGIRVTPSTLALSTTTFAPVVSTPRLVTPGTVALTTTSFAPTVLTPRVVTPTTASLTTTTFAPSIVLGTRVTPSTLALSTTAFAPTVLTPRLVTPGTVSLSLTAFAPVITAGQTYVPGTVALTLTSFVPVVSAPILVTPGTLSLTTTSFAPSVVLGTIVIPGTASLTLTSFAPKIVLGTVVVPATASLTTTSFAPSVSTPILVTPGVVTLTITSFAPTVTASQSDVFVPGTASLVTTSFAPVVTTPRLVTPGTVSLTTTSFAPVVQTPRLVTPGTVSLSLTAFAPNVSVSAGVTVVPGTISLSVASFAPVVSTPRTVTPTTKALTLNSFAPVVSAPRLVTPGTLALLITSFAPVILLPKLVTPPTRALVTTSFAPTVTVTTVGSESITPGTATLTLTTFAPLVIVSLGPIVEGWYRLDELAPSYRWPDKTEPDSGFIKPETVIIPSGYIKPPLDPARTTETLW